MLVVTSTLTGSNYIIVLLQIHPLMYRFITISQIFFIGCSISSSWCLFWLSSTLQCLCLVWLCSWLIRVNPFRLPPSPSFPGNVTEWFHQVRSSTVHGLSRILVSKEVFVPCSECQNVVCQKFRSWKLSSDSFSSHHSVLAWPDEDCNWAAEALLNSRRH